MYHWLILKIIHQKFSKHQIKQRALKTLVPDFQISRTPKILNHNWLSNSKIYLVGIINNKIMTIIVKYKTIVSF